MQAQAEQDTRFRTAERYRSHSPDWCEALKHLPGQPTSSVAAAVAPPRCRMGRPTEAIAIRRYMLHVLIAHVEECLARLSPREHEFVRRYYWRQKDRMNLYVVADEMNLHRHTASQMRRSVVQMMMDVLRGA